MLKQCMKGHCVLVTHLAQYRRQAQTCRLQCRRGGKMTEVFQRTGVHLHTTQHTPPSTAQHTPHTPLHPVIALQVPGMGSDASSTSQGRGMSSQGLHHNITAVAATVAMAA